MALILDTESCKYTYTQAELLELGRKMARSREKLEELDGEMDTFKAQHKFKVQAAEEEEGLNRSRFMAGYEMRPTPMMTLKFRPDGDHALVIRLDTGRVHDKRKLKDDEKQLKLSTEKPPEFIFTVDFYWQGSDEVAELCAEGVPLTKAEAEKVREFTTLKPSRKMLTKGAGK
jgi:hypothetical protein